MATLRQRVLCIPFPVSVIVLFALLEVACVRGKPIVPEEEAVLLSAKAKSPKYRDTELWTAGADCGEWGGVTCDADGHVVSIEPEMLGSLEETSSKLLAKLPFMEHGIAEKAPDQNPKGLRRALSESPKIVSSGKSRATRLKNKQLWEARTAIHTTVRYVPRPILKNRRRQLIRKNTTSPRISVNSLNTCNVGPKWAAVPKTGEDSGIPSGVVAIQNYVDGAWVTACSGWLVSPWLVVTAAQCLYNFETKTYYFGHKRAMKVIVRMNGKADKKTSYSFTFRGYIYDNYVKHKNHYAAGSDLGVLYLDFPLNSQTFKWTSPTPSLVPRTNYGYPAVTQDGYTLIYDVTNLNVVTGCNGGSKVILCEKLSSEGGMSGGPILHAPTKLVLGGYSPGYNNTCPEAYNGLTGTYTLAGLVKKAGCKVSKVYSMSRYIYTATC